MNKTYIMEISLSQKKVNINYRLCKNLLKYS